MRFERTILAMSAAAVASVSTPAFAALDPVDAMALCSRIAKADARVECYDQVARDAAAGLLQSNPAPQAAPQPSQPQPTQAQPTTAERNWAPPAPPSGVTSSGPSWATPPQSSPQPQGNAAPDTSFGAESIKKTGDDGAPKEVEAQVVSATDNGLALWRIELTSGAVWQMTERVSLFRPPAPNETVTIRRGTLGGFLMNVGKQASVRVKRIK